MTTGKSQSEEKWYEDIAWSRWASGCTSVVVIVTFVAILVWGFFITLRDDATLANVEIARGLITFIFATGTMMVALIVLLIGVFLKQGDDGEERFTRGKDVLTILIGILGAIIGFYFGTPTADQQGQQETLEVTRLLLENLNPQEETEISLTAIVTRGNSPYVYSIKFNPSIIDDVENLSRQGLIASQVFLPKVDQDTDVTVTVEVEDSLNHTWSKEYQNLFTIMNVSPEDSTQTEGEP